MNIEGCVPPVHNEAHHMQLIWDETSRRLLFILSYRICWVFGVASMLPSQTDGTCRCVTNERPAQPREEKKIVLDYACHSFVW